jgi:ABC-type amino acid transport substrate-binding protein
LNQQAQNAQGNAQQATFDQQSALRLAAQQLRSGAVDAVIAANANLAAPLASATAAAQKATAVIADIAAAAGLLGSLVSLATAIAGATANPGAVLTAAQGVITAAKPFLPTGSA